MEGTHVMIPWLETPVIYDVRAKPSNVASLTGTKGMCSLGETTRPSYVPLPYHSLPLSSR